MDTDYAVEVTIRNHWPRHHSRLAVFILVGVFFLGMLGLCTLNPRLPWMVLWAGGTFAALAAAAGLALFAAHPVTALKLTTVVQSGLGGPVYQPAEIVRIEFGPDPQEDYVDSPLPVRLCEVRIVPLQHRAIGLTASVGDAVRLRDWAVRKGICIADRQDALAGARRLSGSGPDT